MIDQLNNAFRFLRPVHQSVVCVLTASIMCFGILSPTAVHAQAAADEETEKETLAQPLAVVNVAGLERILSDITFVFEAADRIEMMDGIEDALEKANNLEGFDRTRPMGVMIFLTAGFPPSPEAVGYLPVDSMETLLKTAELGPVVGKKVSETRYEIIGAQRTMYVRMQDNYAFIGTSEELLDREFPNPERYNKTLTSLYDVAAAADLSTVPKGMKDVFLSFLKIQLGSQMQRRDDEPIGVHKVRAANAERSMEVIELIIKHAKRLSIGLNASEEDRNAKFELRIDANEDSPLAEYLQDINEKRSSFERLIDENNPLTVSFSMSISERDRDMYTEMLEGAELELNYQLSGKGKDIDRNAPPENRGVKQVFTAFKDTIQAGHLDAFVQFFGDPKKSFVAIGGMKLLSGTAAADGMQQLMTTFQDAEEIKALEMNVSEHQNVAFHRIQPDRSRAQDRRVYGGPPALYVGAAPRTLWFAVGGDDALPNLKLTMDKMAAPPEVDPRLVEKRPPFRAVFNGAAWMNLPSNDEDEKDPSEYKDEKAAARAARNKERAAQRREWAKNALTEGEDRLVVDYRPVDNGARLQIELDEGFIRMLGQAIAWRSEARAERRAERGNRRRPNDD